jgi:maltose O-acetyltransferase
MHFHVFNLLSGCLPSRAHRARRLLMNACKMRISPSARINAAVAVYGTSLSVDDDTWIGPECRFFCTPEAGVAIGKRCDIAPGVWMVTGSHLLGYGGRRAGKTMSSAINVGDGCWIGARSILLGGVELGPGCVVAAGSTVIPAVYPCNVLLAGAPAVVKKYYDS